MFEVITQDKFEELMVDIRNSLTPDDESFSYELFFKLFKRYPSLVKLTTPKDDFNSADMLFLASKISPHLIPASRVLTANKFGAPTVFDESIVNFIIFVSLFPGCELIFTYRFGVFCIYYIPDDEVKAAYFLKNLQSALKEIFRANTSKINLVKSDNFGTFRLVPYKLKKDLGEMDVSLNYGSKFAEHDNKIKSLLNTSENGLYLFWGEPGTGKTSYINHLTSSVDKKFVFISSPRVLDPSNSSIFEMLRGEDSGVVFIIEDAEKILRSRDEDSGIYIETLLNMTDGLIGCTIKCQFICTFNTGKEKIDKALLRKGRLRYAYEFGKLSIEDANAMLAHLKINHVTDVPMSLTDIYNYEEDNNSVLLEPTVSKIGFK